MRLLIIEGVAIPEWTMREIAEALQKARISSTPSDVILNAGKEKCVIHVLEGEFGEPVSFKAGGKDCIAVAGAAATAMQLQPDDEGKIRIPVLTTPSGSREDGLRGPVVGRKSDGHREDDNPPSSG